MLVRLAWFPDTQLPLDSSKVVELTGLLADAATLDRSRPGDISVGESQTPDGLVLSPSIAGCVLAISSERSSSLAEPTLPSSIHDPSEATFTLLDIHADEDSTACRANNLLYSTDGISFTTLASGLTPFDNPPGINPAEVFVFGAVSAQYIRFDMSSCPQQDPGTFRGCAIGEVAFRQASVPEPGSLALLGLGLLGIGAARRRRV